jgi:hypothetical protein
MFNLEEYEDVATLNKWFIENYPMGRSNLVTEFHDPDKGYIRVRAEIYRDAQDPQPAVSNVAFGARDLYNRNMARYYVEDVATSALGRAIILLKGSSKTATRESMEEVAKTQNLIAETKAKLTETPKEYIPVAKEDDPWTIKEVAPAGTAAEAVALVADVLGGTKIDDDIPSCEHGVMKFRDGVSKKNNKPWAQFSCQNPAGGFLEKCEPIWLEINQDGKWVKQKGRG